MGEDYKAAHKGKTTSMFIEEMNERAKIAKDNLPPAEQAALAAAVRAQEEQQKNKPVLGEVTNKKAKSPQPAAEKPKTEIIQPPTPTEVTSETAVSNNENKKETTE